MPELDYLIVGHVTVDQLSPGSKLGGTATYSALTAARLGRRVGLLTSAAFEPGLVDVLSDVRVARVPAEETTRFVNEYTDGVRHQRVEAVAEMLSAKQLLREWRDAPIVHLAPVAHELEGDFLNAFPKAFLGVTPQGWMRAWDDDGHVSPTAWQNANAVLGRANAVVLSVDDVADRADLETWSERARVLVITHGRAGAVVYHAGGAGHSAAFLADREVDPTGAGDVFAAAFFIRLAESGDPVASADFANCVASFAVEKQGTDAVPTAEQVDQRLRAGLRRSEKP
jgi:sugar/nucleoside kinase (ribokinase family)